MRGDDKVARSNVCLSCCVVIMKPLGFILIDQGSS